MKLKKPIQLSGTVTKFKGDGRKLGYPTANLPIKTNINDGVYFGFADMADWQHHPAIIFIGTPTTLGDIKRRVEAYLLDIPDEDYYDQALILTVVHYHRANQTFASAKELVKEMKNDEAAARQWLSSGNGRL